MAEFVFACDFDDIAEGGAKLVQVEGKNIAIVKHKQSVFATEPICPHRGGNLSEGSAANGSIVCPLHAWTFSLVDGKCSLNEDIKISTYPCFVEEGKVYVNPEAKT